MQCAGNARMQSRAPTESSKPQPVSSLGSYSFQTRHNNSGRQAAGVGRMLNWQIESIQALPGCVFASALQTA